ncbi:UNVERIFIED_CONTAM: hypothetical protein NCL1_39107 [Trichonephila clavipes]
MELFTNLSEKEIAYKMFSSLPSASKIYVSSSKSRQKSASSAKKRRRKVHSGINHRENIAVQSLMNCDQESSDFLVSSDSECRRDSQDSKISQFEREDIQIKKDSHDSEFCKWEREDSASDISCQSAKNLPKIVGNSKVLEQLFKEHQNEVHEPEDEQNKGSTKYFIEEQIEELTEHLKENNEELENRLTLELDEQETDSLQAFAVTLNKKSPENLLVEANESLLKQSEESQSQQSEISVNMNAKENGNSEPANLSVPTINTNTDKMQQSNDQTSSELIAPEITLDEINYTESHVVEHMLVTTEVKETNETEAKLKTTTCDDIVASELLLEEKNCDSVHVEGSFNQNIMESLNSDCTVKINDINENFIDSERNFHSEDSVKSILPSFENTDYLTDNTDKESNHSNNFLIKDDTLNFSNNEFEISTIDENSGQHTHTSHKPRIQSPEQSEISCTESLLDEPKSPIQDNSLQNHDQGVYDSLTSIQDSEEKTNQKNHLKLSQSSTDLLHDNMDSLVSNRCFSLPGDLCFSEESQKFDKTASLGRIAYVDKETLTTDLESENTSKISLSEKKSLCKDDYEDSSEDLHIIKHVSGSDDKISLGNVLPPLAMIKARARRVSLFVCAIQ